MTCSQCVFQKASEQRFCGFCGNFLHQPITTNEAHVCSLCKKELIRYSWVEFGDYQTEQFRHCRRCGSQEATLYIMYATAADLKQATSIHRSRGLAKCDGSRQLDSRPRSPGTIACCDGERTLGSRPDLKHR